MRCAGIRTQGEGAVDCLNAKTLLSYVVPFPLEQAGILNRFVGQVYAGGKTKLCCISDLRTVFCFFILKMNCFVCLFLKKKKTALQRPGWLVT